nr:hypothetical protein [Tanacetum cinerariifolium]
LLVLRRRRKRTFSGVFASLPLTISCVCRLWMWLRRGGGDNHRSNNNYSGNNKRLNFKSIQSSSTHKHDPNIMVPSSPGVPLRATPTWFALRVDADTQESVVKLLVPASSVVKLAIYR